MFKVNKDLFWIIPSNIILKPFNLIKFDDKFKYIITLFNVKNYFNHFNPFIPILFLGYNQLFPKSRLTIVYIVFNLLNNYQAIYYFILLFEKLIIPIYLEIIIAFANIFIH